MKRAISCLVFATAMLFAGTAFANSPGDLVLAKWGDGNYYPARVAEVNDGKVLVSFYDGDVGEVANADVKKFDWKEGSKVQCEWKAKGKYYSGTIKKMKVEWVHISYDDGDQEETGIGRCRSK